MINIKLKVGKDAMKILKASEGCFCLGRYSAAI